MLKIGTRFFHPVNNNEVIVVNFAGTKVHLYVFATGKIIEENCLKLNNALENKNTIFLDSEDDKKKCDKETKGPTTHDVYKLIVEEAYKILVDLKNDIDVDYVVARVEILATIHHILENPV